MAEEQNAHIIEIENKTLHYNFISKLIGQLLIVFLVIALMGFSAVSFLVFKNNIAGIAGILGTVGTTVITAIKKIQNSTRQKSQNKRVYFLMFIPIFITFVFFFVNFFLLYLCKTKKNAVQQ